MIKKLMTWFFGAALIALPATALVSTAHASCYVPEFDAVGLDSANIFVDKVLAEIVANGGSLETSSNFTTYSSGVIYNPWISVQGMSYPDAAQPGVAGLLPFGNLPPAGGAGVGGKYACVASNYAAIPCQPAEFFAVAGTNYQSQLDPCFTFTCNALGSTCHFPYKSVFTPERSGAIYRWRIVLQEKPTSDININIEDCVLTESLNCPTGIFATPGETGFFNVGPYLLFWQQTLPTITAVAIPGPNASLGFNCIQQLYARTQPQANCMLYPVCDLPFVSTALFDESIVVAMPQTCASPFPVGNFASGFTLSSGDMIDVSIGIPETTNPNDYYFGADNVFLKYIGMAGTGVIGGTSCP
ncbi:MAG: hypothetical protein P4L43_02465 [Syntrophobacteraceae bacterium]|nr:hypothetical protein [Syntrophobacteraceae bacterium]